MTTYFSNSSSTAPISLKKRPDIVVEEMSYQGEPYWVCKDPLDQQYHHLNEQEFAIYSWLDGEVSFEEMKARFEIEHTPFRVSHKELAQVLGRFHEQSLVVSTNASQGAKLLEMGREKQRKELKQKFMSVYALKWKGFDPEVFLNATNPYVRWFFSKKTVMVVMAMVLLSAMWLTLHYEQFLARAPSLWSFLDPANWMTLGLVIACTKLIHEFGHAYSFKRFGGEVHEIGVMVFFFMPTMYCNTSDSWLLKDKWERIAIAMGGVYVELFIFSIATFVWWFSSAGTVQDVAINLMFACSLSAVLINGNPLLKYDGYFVLADLVEIPNLAKQSSDQIRRWFMVYGLGITDEASQWISRSNQRFMLLYGIGAYLFRLSLMMTVAFFLVLQAAPYGLAPVGYLFSLVITIIYLCTPLYHLGKSLKTPGTMIKIKRKNLVITLSIVTALICLVFIPFPYYATVDCTVDGGEYGMIVTKESGVLKKTFVRPGDFVEKGEVVVELTNPSLEKTLAETEMHMSDVEIEIENKRHDLSTADPSTSIRSLTRQLENFKTQHEQLATRVDELKVRATIAGDVIGVQPHQSPQGISDERKLQRDHGNLLVSKESTWINAGTEVCHIRNKNETWVTLTVKQADQDLVSEGQDVLMLFNSDRSRAHRSEIRSLSYATESPANLIGFESESATVKSLAQSSQTQSQGSPVNQDGASLESAVILGRCKIESPINLLIGSTGVAKVYIGRRSMAWRTQRLIRLFVNQKL